MKRILAIVVASMSISGMAFAQGWYGPCSEETPNTCECPANEAMYGMWCSGEWCDNNWIRCRAASTGWSYWTDAQYSTGTVWCQQGYAAKELDCHGGYCSGISYECTQTNGATADVGCYWKGGIGTDGNGDPIGIGQGTQCDNADEFVHGTYITGANGSQRTIRCCYFQYGLRFDFFEHTTSVLCARY